jgi:hypothetical protein
VTVPYTRNAVGPMDYTPVTFDTDVRHTADAHELALAVVFESGLQHFADSIESYSARPNAEWLLDRVPVAWDETRFVDGWPGVDVTLARRADEDWLVGSIATGRARTLETTLDFLDAPREGTLVRDGADGLVRDSVTVEPDEPLAVDIDTNGGFVLVLPD